MVDQTRRKLTIPNRYSPYLEKHRIYELFHEMARELVIQQPLDHVLFLKEILYNAASSRYAPRIILLAPPYVNTYDLVKGLAERSKATIVCEYDIISILSHHHYPPNGKRLAYALREVLRSDNTYYTGWILPDFPKTRKEAIGMQHEGVLPTHVFQLIPSFGPSFVHLKHEKRGDSWLKYRRSIMGVRDAFKHNLKEIFIGDKNTHEILDACMELINIKKRYKAPIIPRICLMGPRGSGRKTQAHLLSQSFNLVHVEFENLLCQAWISETYLGSQLRACRDKVGSNSVLLTAVIHKRILQKDCIERGWVLTGFPLTVDDFKHLDMVDTPLNRIIFLECNLTQCRERVINRKSNVYTGSVINVLENTLLKSDTDFKIHPRDQDDLFDAEIKFYCKNYDEIRKYTGCTATVVDASQQKERIAECLQAILMRPLPECEPRTPCPSVTTSDISFAQDDIQSFSCECVDCSNPDPNDVNSIATII